MEDLIPCVAPAYPFNVLAKGAAALCVFLSERGSPCKFDVDDPQPVALAVRRSPKAALRLNAVAHDQKPV